MVRWIDIHEEEVFFQEVQGGAIMALFGERANMIWNMTLETLRRVSPGMPLDKVLSVDTRELPELVQEREVKIIPTARFFYNGRKMSELTGNDVTVDNIHNSIEKLHEAANQGD